MFEGEADISKEMEGEGKEERKKSRKCERRDINWSERGTRGTRVGVDKGEEMAPSELLEGGLQERVFL